MEDFRIEFDASHSVYFPGQIVSGKVLIQNQKSIKARILKICIHGKAHTDWWDSETTTTRNIEGELESDRKNVHCKSVINYLNEEAIAWISEDGNDCLPPGTNIFPFSFDLPEECPPSFEGCDGHIRYSVHVELDRPWKFNKKFKKHFSVVPVFDLNITPGAINPMINNVSKKTGLLFKSGLISVKASLPKRGYVPGEILPITIDIDNGSKNPITSVRSKISQCSHFSARHMMSGYDQESHDHHRNDEKCVAESRRQCDVAPKSQGQVMLSMKIPAVVPSFQCAIIDVDYCITVKIDAGSTFGGTLKVEFPLIIGTIPIRQMAPVGMMASVSGTAPPVELPPSYEESMYAGKAEDSEPFAPWYPVYNNLPPYPPEKLAEKEAEPSPKKL